MGEQVPWLDGAFTGYQISFLQGILAEFRSDSLRKLGERSELQLNLIREMLGFIPHPNLRASPTSPIQAPNEHNLLIVNK